MNAATFSDDASARPAGPPGATGGARVRLASPWVRQWLCASLTLALSGLMHGASHALPPRPPAAGSAVLEVRAEVPRPNPRRVARPRPAREPAAEPRSLFDRVFGTFGNRAPAAASGGGTGDPLKRRLLAAYPGAFAFEGNTIVFASGERVVWDDGRDKSWRELLTDADVQDMFAYPYPVAREGERAPPRLHDPGRVRSQPFFKALYGGSREAMRRSIRRVAWVPSLNGGGLAVTTLFGIDDKVEAISAELERMARRDPALARYLVPPAGGYVWRMIAGTRRLSVHSFGAAVDISTSHANYWRWDGHDAGDRIPFRNRIPMKIVEVFERHCFIWGGRWYHYDTMHFEYRPELLPGCAR